MDHKAARDAVQSDKRLIMSPLGDAGSADPDGGLFGRSRFERHVMTLRRDAPVISGSTTPHSSGNIEEVK
jgi:hypothetical protein